MQNCEKKSVLPSAKQNRKPTFCKTDVGPLMCMFVKKHGGGQGSYVHKCLTSRGGQEKSAGGGDLPSENQFSNFGGGIGVILPFYSFILSGRPLKKKNAEVFTPRIPPLMQVVVPSP